MHRRTPNAENIKRLGHRAYPGRDDESRGPLIERNFFASVVITLPDPRRTVSHAFAVIYDERNNPAIVPGLMSPGTRPYAN